MFYTTEFLPFPKKIIDKIKVRLGLFPIEITENNIHNIPFRTIKGIPYRDKKFFYRLHGITGDNTVILPEKFDITEQSKNGKPLFPHPDFNYGDTLEYTQRLMVDFCLKVLSNCTDTKQHVLLIDIGGNCSGVCAEILRVAHKVSVYTSRPRNYDACIKYTMYTFGCQPNILQKGDKAQDVSLIIAPYGLSGFVPPNRDTPVLSVKPSDNGYYPNVQGIVFHNDIKRICPKGISLFKFAAAVFIQKGYNTSDCCAFLKRGNKILTVEDLTYTLNNK